MSKGKFIVLDGLDGSGKGTQSKRLVDRLKDEGHKIELADFPQYGKWSAQFVEHYLRGEFGSSTEVTARQASYFYALDRYEASFQIRAWLDSGTMVLSNRYVSANKGHQVGKLATEEEMKETIDWINNLEYGELNIPVPDLTIFLHMSPEIGNKLVGDKGEREYLKGKSHDIHEADIEHLRNAERAYLFCLDNDPVDNWKRIVCYEKDQPRTREAIHEDVYALVKDLIN